MKASLNFLTAKNQCFHEITSKGHLLDQNRKQVVGDVMNKVGDNSCAEIMGTSDSIKSVKSSERVVPEWNEETNYCTCHNSFSISSCKIELFEPIALRFSVYLFVLILRRCINSLVFKA